MNDACVPSCTWIGRAPRAFACSLVLIALSSGLAEAQDVQASLDQLKTENAALSGEIQRTNEQLKTLNESIRRLERPVAAPAEAWWALGVVGFVFALAWGIVSTKRENVRLEEAKTERARKIDVEIAQQAKAVEDAVDARIKIILELLREGKKGATGPQSAAASVAAEAEMMSKIVAWIRRQLAR
jgi:hypothetical protein